ncbi:MAG: hypothetical protein WBC04_20955 [Candidatus Acidiferrales bacterium]
MAAADRAPWRSGFIATAAFSWLLGPVLFSHGLVSRIAALSAFSPLLDNRYGLRLNNRSPLVNPSLFVMFFWRALPLLDVVDNLLVGYVRLTD